MEAASSRRLVRSAPATLRLLPRVCRQTGAELRDASGRQPSDAGRHGAVQVRRLGAPRRRPVDTRGHGARLRPQGARQAALLGHLVRQRGHRVPPANSQRVARGRGHLLVPGGAHRRLGHQAGGARQAHRAGGAHWRARDHVQRRVEEQQRSRLLALGQPQDGQVHVHREARQTGRHRQVVPQRHAHQLEPRQAQRDKAAGRLRRSSRGLDERVRAQAADQSRLQQLAHTLPGLPRGVRLVQHRAPKHEHRTAHHRRL